MPPAANSTIAPRRKKSVKSNPTPTNAEQRRPANPEQQLQAQFARLEQQFQMLKEQSRQAQQLASLGTAAAMLAHEFNNLMSPVVGYANHALQSDDPQLMRKALEMTVRQTDILTAMSDRILGLAANETRKVQPVALRELIDESIACMCRDLRKDSITLKNNIADSVRVQGDPRLLTQVFFNLLINARQAINHRSGRIVISAEPHDNGTLEIRVADNGAGIAPEVAENMFEPFQTTKSADRPNKSGMGLGLTLVHDIIEEHRGDIRVESKLGEGATFIITLPLAG